jgi:hypothetical protein
MKRREFITLLGGRRPGRSRRARSRLPFQSSDICRQACLGRLRIL